MMIESILCCLRGIGFSALSLVTYSSHLQTRAAEVALGIGVSSAVEGCGYPYWGLAGKKRTCYMGVV